MGISRQVVTFEVKSQMYGADIFLLDEILPMMEFREIPKGPSFLEGLINLRGEMIPLVDLRKTSVRQKFLTASQQKFSSFVAKNGESDLLWMLSLKLKRLRSRPSVLPWPAPAKKE
jgi:purine-binding chemotaxis protein CheW